VRWQSRPSLSSSAHQSEHVVLLPRFVRVSTRTWELNRPRASARSRVSTIRRPTSVPSMTLHTSFGRRGVSALLRTSAFVRFRPRLRFSTFPRRGRRTTPRSCEHKALPQTEGQPGIFPTSRVFGVDSDCTLRLWQSQQRESCAGNGLGACYPSLTPLADKQQIFC